MSESAKIMSEDYWFIRTQKFETNIIPAYSLINKRISLQDVDIINKGDLNEFKKNNMLTIDEFLKDYKITGPL